MRGRRSRRATGSRSSPAELDEPDRECFAGLVCEHGRAVHAYLSRRAGRQVADDLFSQVWLEAWRSRAGYDRALGAPLPWLYGVARNTLRAHFRRRADIYPTGFELGVDPWPEVDDSLDAAATAMALERGLNLLNDEQREILLLVAWEHLSPTEIATSLQMSPSTVRTRLHRARILLRQHLEMETNEPRTADLKEPTR